MAEETKNQVENLAAEELKEELETAKALAEENLNGWKRAKADLANFQKNTEKQKQELIMFSLASYVLATLPIYESLEKMIEAVQNLDPSIRPDKSGLAQGVSGIKKQFDDLFKNLGVNKIETVGKKFDPNFHESVGVRKSAQGGSRQAGEEGKETDTILEEVQAGYLMGEKVIRPAKVVVAE